MAKKKPASERKRAPNGQGTPSFDGRYYRLDVSLGRDQSTGKLIRKTVRADTESEAIAKAQKLRVEFNESGVYTEPSKLTVGQWLDIWHQEYLGNVKPDTSDRYELDIRLYLKPNLGGVKLKTLSPHTIQTVYNKLHRGADGKKALAAKSIRNLNGTLHSAMEKALILKYIPHNPTKGVTLPRVEKREMAVIKDEDVSRFLAAIKGHQYEMVYLMDMFTGLRQAEILGLTWANVSFDSGTINVKQQLKKERKKGGKYYFAPLKTDRTRMLTASQFVMNLLRQQRRTQAEWRLRAGGAWDNDVNLVFTTGLGRHLVAVTVYNNLKTIVRSMGLDAVRFHDLRHTFALLSLENGDDIKTLQENLGHSNISTTLNVYGHVSERMKKDSAARMDARIETLLR
jgi:integrase